jgi:hypothetical protein
MNSGISRVICAWAMLAAVNCAGRRVNQFQDFAEAGRAYSDAMSELTKETGNAAVDADSAVLIASRDGLGQQERIDALTQHKEALQELLAVLSDLRQHTMVLRRYFASLAELAGEDIPSGIADEASELVRELQAISPQLASARIGDTDVFTLVGQAVPFAVGHFQATALESHLNAHAATLEREIEIHRAAVAALAASTKADFEAVMASRETETVARPFVLDGELPGDWEELRRQAITAQATLDSLDQAVRAAEELKRLFLALVENKGTPTAFRELFGDINAVLDFIELARATSRGESHAPVRT